MKAAAPTKETKIGLNITSISFMQPIMNKISKYSSVVKNFVLKKFEEMRIIYSGLMDAIPTGGPLRPPGAPVMQVTRPLASPSTPRRTIDAQFLPPANTTA